ncbi:MAG TPA: glycine zipper 2TM domain-containing protein [Ramlibacter sp.]|uniref:glycine zipper 2TM domain-containing protein n=1 Tax=Ramlibacter sp. TaxID=1917967 RepID=UPI002CD3608A|nr:glycine zipper 2TM domain-containing protein [Ramlibacter sp.]HVZ46214.1 glycine zipper 2TM domain-containing protein [Ramlibacter sp.]
MKLFAHAFLFAASALAQAQPAPAFIDRARVQEAQPQYETVQVPRNECARQWVTEATPASVSGGSGIGGTVIGGATGALIGSQIGKGSGRDAAIGVGAVIGALAGNRIATRDSVVTAPTYEQREVRTCHTVADTQTRLTGYRVTYEYRGHLYTTFTREQPGATVPVRVAVTPLDEAEYHRAD